MCVKGLCITKLYLLQFTLIWKPIWINGRHAIYFCRYTVCQSLISIWPFSIVLLQRHEALNFEVFLCYMSVRNVCQLTQSCHLAEKILYLFSAFSVVLWMAWCHLNWKNWRHFSSSLKFSYLSFNTVMLILHKTPMFANTKSNTSF